MKKIILSALFAFTVFTGFCSCGNLMTQPSAPFASDEANAGTNDLTGVLGQLMNVLSSKLVPTESQIIGTWTYQSPAVVFTSQNVLTSLGGNVASSGIESKLQSYLTKYGITKGTTSITFNKDKTFSVNSKGKVVKGKYVVTGQNVQLTFDGMQQPSRMTPQLNNGTLIIVGDATKLMTFMQGLGAASTNVQMSTITSLMKQFDGMQVGIRLQRK